MKRGDGGFTLIEVLMAMVLTALVGGAVTSSIVFTTNTVGENTLASEAITLAQSAMEDLRTVTYDDIADGTTMSPDGQFTIERIVLDDTPGAGMKEIEVTVTWNWKGQPRQYALHTVYSQINKT